MLQAENLSYQVGRATLVSGVNLSVEKGEVVAVLGPNGAGKSTLLKLLCGQLRPTEGRVLFAGRELGGWPLRELACRRAVLPQQSSVPFDFTALEIVLLGRSPYGDAASRIPLARQAMEWTECAHLAERTVSTLSGGELQRVNLARVLVQIGLEPGDGERCLMLDEPISNLDPSHQHAALRIARRMAGDGTAVLVVLHDLNLAAQYADRIVLMKDSRIAAEGSPREILQPALIGEVFSVRAMLAENPISGTPAIFVDAD